MDLNHLYSLRRDFTIIGLTGRTGSGCTKISELLSQDFDNLKKCGLREISKLDSDDIIFRRKYEISKNFFEEKGNWVPFEQIRYKDLILFFMLKKNGTQLNKYKALLQNYFKEFKDENNSEIVEEVFPKFKEVIFKHEELINEIKKIKKISSIRLKRSLLNLNELYFEGRFKILCNELFDVLETYGYYRRAVFLHKIASNIRSYGSPMEQKETDIKNIYTLAELINKLIKARKVYNHDKSKSTKIVIDSLRNSLEIMFFKERYSSFYMIATKDVLGNSRQRLKDRLLSKCEGEKEIEDLVNKLMSLDAIEYKTKDFYRGKFSSPDVENCIQKSDYHILNIKIEDFEKENYSPIIKNDFITREEQLMKLISLIMQPGIITPSFVERTMQIANTAKANSGCISRKVGAVILDKNLSIRSIGWNDVAKGHTPCNLRNVEDFLGEHPLNVEHYSDFELGNHSDISEYKYKTSNPNNFRDALKDFYKQSYDKDKLKGKNCSFCFKTVHNHYEGDGNQVHTRSLHAEENAMLQLTKYGGQGVENGILFTTASPCELCSKKAYQLGIKVIYYIDPYPGISQDQILKGGNISNRPKMMAFSGAMGTTYHKLYESFLSYKDELSLVLDIKPKNKLGIQFKNILESISSEKEFLSYIREKNGVITNEEVIGIIKKGLRK